MSESDEWASDIKASVLALVIKAVKAERDAIVDFIKLDFEGYDGYDPTVKPFMESLVEAIKDREMLFQGERI